MCSINCIIFGAKSLSRNEIEGKKVIEIGSYDMNGSLRPMLESWGPSEYIGVDIEKGPGVDVVCSADDMLKKFGKESFDIVISTEVLEHVRDWKKVVSNMKNICKPNGLILITTRSYGCGYHGCPYDFWRYELKDMRKIFSDCKILILEKDQQAPGVFLKIRKSKRFAENDLSEYSLYNIVLNKKVEKITDRELESLPFKIRNLRFKIRLVIKNAGKSVLYKI